MNYYSEKKIDEKSSLSSMSTDNSNINNNNAMF